MGQVEEEDHASLHRGQGEGEGEGEGGQQGQHGGVAQDCGESIQLQITSF